MKFTKPFSVAVAAITMFMGLSSLQARVWTSTDGRQLEGEFVGMESGVIELKMKNGRSVSFGIDKLIAADREAAERFMVVGDDTLTMLSAKRIDGLLAKNLVANGIRSFNDPIPDDLFVRRVYLDIVGRIPTREEFLAFAESVREDKRAALIDELLMEPGRASHLFNYFADMYRLQGDADLPPGLRMEPYIQWWKEQLQDNRPYDEMVKEMVTAVGNMGQNPASGFLIRDAGMEFDAFSNFGQVMLGIDISCAQCHDHPFDDWTMADFYEMAAFFGQTQRTLARYASTGMMGMAPAAMPNAPEGWKMEFEDFAQKKGINLNDPQGSRWFRYYVNNALGYNVADNEAMDLPVPTTVAEIGGEVFKPRPLLGESAKMSGKTRREALAEWLVAKENTRFAMVIANRMWSRAFGLALAELPQDFPVEWERATGQPEVMGFLASEMVRVGYDLREFMRILYNTRAYQSMPTVAEPAASEKYLFAGPILRRMRAEQAWDSLMLLAHGSEIDAVRGRDGSFMREVLDVDFENDSMEDIWAKYEAYDRNKRYLADGVVSEPGSLSPSSPDVPRLGNLELIRASEMQQPAPGASLLDTFGQSDRFVTDEHTYDGSVPQVLALMNGSVTDRLTGTSSKVVEDLSDLDAVQDKVRGVFFTILSRFPSEEELEIGVDMLGEYGDAGIRDLTWACMNSPEFLFIQ